MSNVVVYADIESADEVRAHAAIQLGVEPSALELVTVSALAHAPPRVFGEAKTRPCVRLPATRFDVESEFNRAAGAWGRHETDVAQASADRAVEMLGCLKEPVDSAVASRLFLLRANLAVAAHAPDSEARAEFQSALAFAPLNALDPSPSKAWSDELRELPLVSLALYPASSRGPWVDGRELEGGAGAVAPGLHLIQQQGPSGLLTLWVAVQSASVLVRPEVASTATFGDLSSPSARIQAAWFLRGAEPATADVWWSVGGALYAVDWSVPTLFEVAPPAPVPLAPPTVTKGRHRH